MVTLAKRIDSASLFRLVTVLAGLAVLYPVSSADQSAVVTGSIVFLAAAAFAAERFPLELPGYGMVSGLEAAVLAALMLNQPTGAVLVLAAGVLSRAMRRGQAFRWDFSLYTFFQLSLCFAAPFALLSLVAPASVVGFALAAVSVSILDQCCASLHLFFLQDRIGRPSTRLEWSRVRLTALVLMPLGLLLGSCLKLGPVTTLLLFLPLALAFKGIKGYIDTLREAREVIASLVEAVEAREDGSSGHAERVAALAGDIAREMGLKERTVRRIVTAGRMHDLGKIGIEESILNKTEALSETDLESLRRHPEVGARVAAHLSLGKQESEFIYYHHENFDGTGYPCGLAGQAIPQGARILAVAEAFDCMVSSPRRDGRLTTPEALQELERVQGQQFDPHVVAAVKAVLKKKSA